MKILNVNDVLYEVLGEYNVSRENADIAKSRWCRIYEDIVMLAPTANHSNEWLICRKIDDAEFDND